MQKEFGYHYLIRKIADDEGSVKLLAEIYSPYEFIHNTCTAVAMQYKNQVGIYIIYRFRCMYYFNS